MAEIDDVLVIGAGVAGLAAASLLAREGLRVSVIEARHRVGGRIWTLQGRDGWPIELGAEFLHGAAKPLQRVALQAGLGIYDVRDEHVLMTPLRRRKVEDFWPRLARVMGRMDAERSPDRSFAEYLRGVRARRTDRRLARSFVEGFDAVDAGRASERALARAGEAEALSGGERTSRLSGGYGSLVEVLFRRCVQAGARIRLSRPVKRVEWRAGRVRVEASDPSGEIFEARHAVIALPIGVLALNRGDAGAVEFDPAVPGLRPATEAILPGSVTRVVLRFDEPFWERLPGGDELAFFHSPDEEFPTWWTSLPARSAQLTAWAGGPAAERLAGLPRGELGGRAILCLSRLLGVRSAEIAERLLEVHHHDWSRDPFTRGAYSTVATGGVEARDRLLEPVQDTLWFAGESFGPGGAMGTVDAAMSSGERAAAAIIARARIARAAA